MPRLSPASVEFAGTHITHFWDSDFFPKPFEFSALWASWSEVLQYLTSRDVSELPVKAPRIMAAPKPGGSFRVVHQLDPIDTLTYTALAFTVAPAVERKRAKTDVACSYRVAIDSATGKFFGGGSGFPTFLQQSRMLADSHPYVLVTDITDFYNQIYLHRLQNSISSCDPALDAVAKDVEDFLTRVNGVSHGVPVGPVASVVMAEAVLTDVDEFLHEQGLNHTRYVNDFRIFGSSRVALTKLLAEMTLYLHSNHRLVLSSSKTEIVETEQFVRAYLDDPEELERRHIHEALDTIGPISGYEFADDDPVGDSLQTGPPDVAKRTAALIGLMDRVCRIRPLDLGLARHIFRRARRYRLRAILPQLFDSFDLFAPVMSDVALYLRAVTNKSFLDRYRARLHQLLEGHALKLDYVRLWIANWIVDKPLLLEDERLRSFVCTQGDDELNARAALRLGLVSWVRERKYQIHSLSPWARRQVLRASFALAGDERRHWYDWLERNPLDDVERWVIRWTRSQ
jgi:reverse transcriptase-like protein